MINLDTALLVASILLAAVSALALVVLLVAWKAGDCCQSELYSCISAASLLITVTLTALLAEQVMTGRVMLPVLMAVVLLSVTTLSIGIYGTRHRPVLPADQPSSPSTLTVAVSDPPVAAVAATPPQPARELQVV